MKHIGRILKAHIEARHMKKGDIAATAGISYNYLSTIFRQPSCDARLLERLYLAAGLDPAIVFEQPPRAVMPPAPGGGGGDTDGGATPGTDGTAAHLRQLLDAKNRIIDEKERLIQYLLAAKGLPRQ